MKRALLLLIFICCVLLLSCAEPYCYKNVDTGVTAIIDSSKENMYGVDNLIINGEEYSLIKDDNLNVIHAGDNVEIISPFANFGENNAYTLYEIKTDLPFKVYIDNKNKALFCLEKNVEECKKRFTAMYDNPDSSVIITDEDNSIIIQQ